MELVNFLRRTFYRIFAKKPVIKMWGWKVDPYLNGMVGFIGASAHPNLPRRKDHPEDRIILTSRIISMREKGKDLLVETRNSIYRCVGSSIITHPENCMDDFKRFAEMHDIPVERLFGEH